MRAFRLAYDGTEYYGFQRQPSVPTVEGRLFEGLSELGVLSETSPKPEGYAAAGRTDRDVSATHQTVAFSTPDWLTPAALNSELPATIRAWATADVPDSFHATHDAESREYTYLLYEPGIDESRARNALSIISGTHDFHNFTPDDEGTVRTLKTTLTREGELLRLHLQADGFARQLVRRIVSVVSSIAVGDRSMGYLDELLAETPVSGPDGVAPAPAEPLILTDVQYNGVTFVVDTEAKSRTQEVFAEQHRQFVARTAVLSDLAMLGDVERT